MQRNKIIKNIDITIIKTIIKNLMKNLIKNYSKKKEILLIKFLYFFNIILFCLM